jgi:hypothetical protein
LIVVSRRAPLYTEFDPSFTQNKQHTMSDMNFQFEVAQQATASAELVPTDPAAIIAAPPPTRPGCLAVMPGSFPSMTITLETGKSAPAPQNLRRSRIGRSSSNLRSLS